MSKYLTTNDLFDILASRHQNTSLNFVLDDVRQEFERIKKSSGFPTLDEYKDIVLHFVFGKLLKAQPIRMNKTKCAGGIRVISHIHWHSDAYSKMYFEVTEDELKEAAIRKEFEIIRETFSRVSAGMRPLILSKIEEKFNLVDNMFFCKPSNSFTFLNGQIGINGDSIALLELTKQSKPLPITWTLAIDFLEK